MRKTDRLVLTGKTARQYRGATLNQIRGTVTTMTFHLSQATWDKLRGESYQVLRVGGGMQARQGDNMYHINDSEEGICSTCKQHYRSIAVNSPAELEMVKHYLETR